MSSHKFDKEYFEDGIRSGKSLYKNFRWMPEVSMPTANTVKQTLDCSRILDYGCAKGFTVYALRLLGVEAYGYDISDYALKNCKKEVKKYLYKDRSKIPAVDGIFVKDVLEHVEYANIDDELKWICQHCKKAFIVVPLGSDGEYRISEYVFDLTHVIKEDEEWWSKKFIEAGFTIDEFYHCMPGIKENWCAHNAIGNGFFILSSGD